MSVNLEEAVLVQNGKIYCGRAGQTKASGITFDNTNSDLVSEDVESAIKEVNEKTKHGIVELWVNSSPTSAFAGQTINISQSDLDSRGLDVNVNDIDAVTIEFEVSSLVLSTSQGRIGTTIQASHTSVISSGKVVTYIRTCNINRANNTISITVNDCTRYLLNTYGSAPATTTDNDYLIPTIITGLIHNA